MPRVLPPPRERFDPITARWVTPGRLPHDPEREDVDPQGREPVRLVAPVPPELAGVTEDGRTGRDADPSRRLRVATLAVGALGLAAFVAARLVLGAG